MLSALFIATAAAASSPVPGEMKVFKDWYVACDNVWSCEAGTLATADDDFTGAMAVRVRREGGPSARFRIVLHPGEDSTPGKAQLKIDARTPSAGSLDSEGDTWLDENAVPSVARRLATGKNASLRLADGKDMALSLAGSSAALRYMDAVQKRVGTVGAIVATGSRSDTALPPQKPRRTARKAPAIANLPAMKDYPEVIKASQCEYRMEGIEDSVFPLDRRNGKDMALALIVCDSGAYNFGSAVMIAERPSANPKAKWTFRKAQFDWSVGWGDDVQPSQVVNADFSPETGMLTDSAKGRGLGDCGTASVFAWDGTMFRLSEMHSMGDCRGVWDWPRLWITDVSLVR